MKNKYALYGLILLCVACSSERAGLKELKRLCEKDAGLKIYKTVEAEGYYDTSRKGGVLRILIPSKYSFVEFCNLNADRPSFGEPGCWRLTKVSRETGQCSKIVDGALASSDGHSYPEFRERYCIAVEKIEKPKARYSYHNSIRFWSAKNEVSEFGRAYVEIRERESGELLGQYISYSYNKRPKHTTPIDCPNINKQMPSFAEANLVERTIIPLQGEVR